jgi:citrate synthase
VAGRVSAGPTSRIARAYPDYFLDLLLVAIAEHGLMPSNVAARMTLAADPRSLHGAVAAGILGAGPVFLGTAGDCAFLLSDAVASGTSARELVRGLREAGERVPGFGHPLHRVADPRAERILELAQERGVDGPHLALAGSLRGEVVDASGGRLPMNVSLPIAAVLLDLGYPASTVGALPILARVASLLAHLQEERERPIGLLLAQRAEQAVEYEPPDR